MVYKKIFLISFFLLSIIISFSALVSAQVHEYNPQINPADFSTTITNKYFSLTPGKKYVLAGINKDGAERIEITVDGSTKTIMGVQTLIYHDRVWANNILIEDTFDYLAQDTDGNVWYFGEDVNNYKDGTIINHNGSWTAGVDYAKPGIWMKATPEIRDVYRQEYYKGVAEDMAAVVSIDDTVTTATNTYQHCLKIHEWTPLASNSDEFKYYCPEVATNVLIEEPAENGRTILKSIEDIPSTSKEDSSGIYIVVSTLILASVFAYIGFKKNREHLNKKGKKRKNNN